MNNFLSLSDLLNCYFLERNAHIGLKLLKLLAVLQEEFKQTFI